MLPHRRPRLDSGRDVEFGATTHQLDCWDVVRTDLPLLGNPAGVDEACESGAGRSSAVDLSAALAGGGVEVELAAEDRRRDGAVADDAYVGVGCGAEFGMELAILERE